MFFMKAGKTNFMMHFQLLRHFCPLTVAQNILFSVLKSFLLFSEQNHCISGNTGL